MIDNGECQTMQNDRRLGITDNGNVRSLEMMNNGEWQTMVNNRQGGMTDNGE